MGIKSVSKYEGVGNQETHNIPYPENINDGDLLLFQAMHQNTATDTPEGWTRIGGGMGQDIGDAFYPLYVRECTGAETGTFPISINTPGGRPLAGILVHAETWLDWEQAVVTENSLDPPSLTASWGADAGNFWLAFAAGRNIAFTSGPSGFDNYQVANASGASNTPSLAYADLEDAGATVNPGAFQTSDAGGATFRVASTVVIQFSGTGLAFTTPPTVTARTTNSYTLTGTANADCDVFAVATLPGADDPDGVQIVSGTDGEDNPGQGTGMVEATGGVPFQLLVEGSDLDENPAHDIHVVPRRTEES